MLTSEWLNIALGVLLVVSEGLPYLEKHRGNGIVDTIVSLLKSSAAKVVNTKEETIEP